MDKTRRPVLSALQCAGAHTNTRLTSPKLTHEKQYRFHAHARVCVCVLALQCELLGRTRQRMLEHTHGVSGLVSGAGRPTCLRRATLSRRKSSHKGCGSTSINCSITAATSPPCALTAVANWSWLVMLAREPKQNSTMRACAVLLCCAPP